MSHGLGGRSLPCMRELLNARSGPTATTQPLEQVPVPGRRSLVELQVWPDQQAPAANHDAKAKAQEPQPAEKNATKTPLAKEANHAAGAKLAGGEHAGASTAMPGAAAAASAKVATRTPDGLVDRYMETHWVDTELYAKVAEIGHMPDAVGTELDHWLPPTLNPKTRATLNLVCGAAGGALDGVVMGMLKAMPGIGLPAIALGSLNNALTVHQKYGKEGVNDPEGEKLGLAREAFNLVGGITENLANGCTLVEDICHGLAIPSAGLTEIVGIPVSAIGESLRFIAFTCNLTKLAFDAVMFTRDRDKAEEAEARGDFAQAGKYRDLMFGDATNALVDVIGTGTSMVSLLTANMTPGGGAEAETAFRIVPKIAGTFDKLKLTSKGLPGPSGAGKGASSKDKVSGSGTGGGAVANAKNAVGLGDPMTESPDALFGEHFIPRNLTVAGPYWTDEHATLQAARSETITQLSGDYQALLADPPKWSQALINKLATPSSGTTQDVIDATTPAGLIKHAFHGMRHAGALLGDGTLDSIAAGCERGAGLLATIVGPATKQLGELVATNKPVLGQILVAWNQALQRQELDLESLEKAIKSSQKLVSEIGNIATHHAAIDGKANVVTANAAKLRLDADRLKIPGAARIVANPIINKVNGIVSRLQDNAAKLKQQVLAKVDGQLAAATQAANAKIAELQKMSGEGSQFRQATRQQFTMFKQSVDGAMQAFTRWDGTMHVDVSGTGAWLRDVAREARARTKHHKEDRWKTEVLPRAQQEVDRWRAQHGGQVKTQFHPPVRAAEITAIKQAKASLERKLAPKLRDPEWAAEAQEVQHRLDAADVGSGGEGKQALLSVWASADALGQLANEPIFHRTPDLDRVVAPPAPPKPQTKKPESTLP